MTLGDGPLQTFPARLHVLLAREAPVGLVIRRGPARQVATILWNRETDAFTVGQWLKGRIYERRCDISPDGAYFIYHAMDGSWIKDGPGAWTGVSRVPYLKALAFYPHGSCVEGGGVWTSSRTYWLDEGDWCPDSRRTMEVTHQSDYSPSLYPGRVRGDVYPARLIRDGWEAPVPYCHEKPQEMRFRKAVGHGWFLERWCHWEYGDSTRGRAAEWDSHRLVHAELGAEAEHLDWEWADLDRERLVWACGGKLFAGRVTPEGLVDEREVYDFNGMRFERMKAPY